MLPLDSEQCRDILIVAGEASGDLHGSHLIKAAAAHHPHLKFSGVGGDKMVAAGCRILFPSDELSVMGVVEVINQLPKIYRRFKQLKRILNGTQRPDLLILIDFPDFNLRLAKVAKAVGIPVLYYISPKVWAWRSGRAKVIANRVDRLALIFPFEPEIYSPLGVKADYVGNPLLDEFVENQPTGELRHRLGIKPEEQVVGIFPGSRNSELEHILEALVETAQLLHQQKPEVQFLIPVAPSLSREVIEQRFSKTTLPVFIVEENIYEVAAACDAVLTVSGTVTLQIALVGTPMAILYKVAPLSYALGKRLIKIEFAGLTNIVAGRGIVREFIQDDAQPPEMCAEVLRLLDDSDYTEEVQKNLAEVRQTLGAPGCSTRVAAIAAAMTTSPLYE
ncbi:lipid-A-disaccharide synthase [Desulfuromusa kysingii]|uniref:Lipid-A-disaccharide synthase n=1 Tax=Desulfuromusa kysingii TaxID=37625 RepID=A0A1H3YFA4_9BACT|nr:lipid-A-disaccharide synthase [Desulfuromusa kysingii]SEA10245.1 lipid-A-disaccharide synthase [Desulfuromusa kysingii]